MKLVDTHVLLYAVNTDAPQHAAAHAWLKRALAGPQDVALAWSALLGFLRMSTRNGVMSSPLPLESALLVLNRWLTAPAARVVHPGEQHAALVGRLLLGAGTAGNLVSDAHFGRTGHRAWRHRGLFRPRLRTLCRIAL